MLAPSLVQALLLRDKVLALCNELGILVTYKKLHLVPSQKAVYLGIKLDSTTSKALSTQERIHSFLMELEEYLSHHLQLAEE